MNAVLKIHESIFSTVLFNLAVSEVKVIKMQVNFVWGNYTIKRWQNDRSRVQLCN